MTPLILMTSLCLYSTQASELQPVHSGTSIHVCCQYQADGQLVEPPTKCNQQSQVFHESQALGRKRRDLGPKSPILLGHRAHSGPHRAPPQASQPACNVAQQLVLNEERNAGEFLPPSPEDEERELGEGEASSRCLCLPLA